jgi:hypothetical protein
LLTSDTSSSPVGCVHHEQQQLVWYRSSAVNSNEVDPAFVFEQFCAKLALGFT